MTELADLNTLYDDLAAQIRARIDTPSSLYIVGICSGGVVVAHALAQRLGTSDSVGELGISFYRDDFSRIGLHPKLHSTTLPTSLEGRDVLLVDDVLYSGRTVRAALNALFDFGRPTRVSLAVLVERKDGRELPIRADFVGQHLHLDAQRECRLDGGQLIIRQRTPQEDA